MKNKKIINPKSLKFKIILSSAVCILVVGLLSNVYLYYYLTDIISDKADRINRLHLETVQNQIDQGLHEFLTMGNLSSTDLEVTRAMLNPELTTLPQKREVLRAQEVLKNSFSSSLPSNRITAYVDKFMVFNQSGIMAQVAVMRHSLPSDPHSIQQLEIFKELQQQGNRQRVVALSPSIADGKDCIALLSPLYDTGMKVSKGWLYMELNTNFISDILKPYTSGEIFVAAGGGTVIGQPTGELPPELFSRNFAEGDEIRVGNKVFKVNQAPLAVGGLYVYSYSDVTFLLKDGYPIVYTIMVVSLTLVLVAVLLAVLLSGIITRPLNRLTRRIRKISDNDFSYDPEIEKGGDEIAEMGKVVNEMTVSIGHLLQETEEMYKQRKNSEIALLQSQVNPHFLYNTLNSIHWMATIQKNTGIITVTRSLSNLLKNLAKGVGDKITLAEELSLLKDYVEIQSIRYMDTFTLVDKIDPALHQYTIVKFTLQPLVENAIFHGIEPTGRYGTVVLEGREEEDCLVLTVTDDGVGMTEEELEKLLTKSQVAFPSGLSGIGVSNVNNRLKLVYGKEFGLSYESEKDVFTRVTLRIPKEC